MIVGALVLVEVTAAITEASMTLSPVSGSASYNTICIRRIDCIEPDGHIQVPAPGGYRRNRSGVPLQFMERAEQGATRHSFGTVSLATSKLYASAAAQNGSYSDWS